MHIALIAVKVVSRKAQGNVNNRARAKGKSKVIVTVRFMHCNCKHVDVAASEYTKTAWREVCKSNWYFKIRVRSEKNAMQEMHLILKIGYYIVVYYYKYNVKGIRMFFYSM